VTSAVLDRRNVQCDATALKGGVVGWLSRGWKVGIHDLFDIEKSRDNLGSISSSSLGEM